VEGSRRAVASSRCGLAMSRWAAEFFAMIVNLGQNEIDGGN